MTAVICVPICPILSEPREGGELADEGLYGMSVSITKCLPGRWCKVKTHYGYEGFVQKAHLLLDERWVRPWCCADKRVVYFMNFCDVLRAPSAQAEVLLTLPRGAVLAVEGEAAEGWQAVRLQDGQKGYTRSCILDEYYTTPPPLGEEDLRSRLTGTALSYIGSQYRWGGKTPAGIDCSGLVFMAYMLCGIFIWRDAAIKEGYPVRKIPLKDVKAGDLLFFPGHVAMYLADGRYVHSTGASDSGGVAVNSLNPCAPDYRRDLAEGLLWAGSVF